MTMLESKTVVFESTDNPNGGCDRIPASCVGRLPNDGVCGVGSGAPVVPNLLDHGSQRTTRPFVIVDEKDRDEDE